MKKSYYYAAMDECLTVLVDAINSKRKSADYYRTEGCFKDAETGEPREYAKNNALECDAIADEMEKILHRKFNV